MAEFERDVTAALERLDKGERIDTDALEDPGTIRWNLSTMNVAEVDKA